MSENGKPSTSTSSIPPSKPSTPDEIVSSCVEQSHPEPSKLDPIQPPSSLQNPQLETTVSTIGDKSNDKNNNEKNGGENDDDDDEDDEDDDEPNNDPQSDSETADIRVEPVRRGVPSHKPVVEVEGDKISADENLLDGYDENIEDLDLVHVRITSIPNLKLDRFKKLVRLCLRQNMIRSIKLPPPMGETLEELDLYDNSISKIKGLDTFAKLTSLDLSFNHIEHIKHIDHMTELVDLFFVQNNIKKIKGLDTLTKLTNLELGANSIRTIENLEKLHSLEQLWLGKNKITSISGLDGLPNLRLLSIQANRLTDLSGLSNVKSLKELYISHNAITSLEPLRDLPHLQIVDVSNNPITSLSGVSELTELEDLWASNCKLEDYDDVRLQCQDLKNLETIYLEGNPLYLNHKNQYRQRIIHMLPQIKQLDANVIRS